jgi:Tol biopolymer transport system component
MPGNRILFVAKSGDSSHLFEIGIEPPGLTSTEWRLESAAKRLTSGTEQDERPSVAMGASGTGARRVAFASMGRAEHLWSLDLNTSQPGPGGKVRQLTQESGFQIFPSISRDGTKLAFISHAAYNDEVWLLDLGTGKRLLLSNKVSIKFKPLVHADGSRVIWEDGPEQTSYTVPVSGGAPEKVCNGCGFPTWSWDWSDDYARVLHYSFKSSFVFASITNLKTGNRSPFLESPDKNFYDFRWSPDGRWIVFRAESEAESRTNRSRVYVAPVSGDQGPSETAWIPLTDGSTKEESLKWSPDGSWIYSFSNRDSFDCIWAYPVDPRTGRPSGSAIAVFHSHDSRLSLRNANQISREIAVARDKVVFNQGEITGNIWMTEISQ